MYSASMSLGQSDARFVFKGTFGHVKKVEKIQNSLDPSELERFLSSLSLEAMVGK